MFKRYNSERGQYRSKEAFENAVIELKNYCLKYKKIPTTKIAKIKKHHYAISKGYWKKYGVSNWNDYKSIASEFLEQIENKSIS